MIAKNTITAIIPLVRIAFSFTGVSVTFMFFTV